MLRWIDYLLVGGLIIVVSALTVTSMPAFSGHALAGNTLIAHMMASGVLVVGLPVFAIAFLRHFIGKGKTSGTQQLGYIAVVLTGLLSIATVFLCMLPIPSTDQMHTLIFAHRWVGLAMLPAVAVFLIGMRLTARSA